MALTAPLPSAIALSANAVALVPMAMSSFWEARAEYPSANVREAAKPSPLSVPMVILFDPVTERPLLRPMAIFDDPLTSCED